MPTAIRNKKEDQILTFEMLDAMLGDSAPFLIALSDGLQEALSLVIAGSKTGDVGSCIPAFDEVDETTRETLHEILAETRPIEPDEQCLYRICFQNYIIYQVRNESFSLDDPDAIRHGRYLITFEKSEFLSRLQTVTYARAFEDGSFFPGRWVHYGICTQNHIIDVIAQDMPDISEINELPDGSSPI